MDFDGHSLIDNDKLGKLVDLWMISIHQNGGFTQVWLGLKTFFFPAIVLELWWMNRRFVLPYFSFPLIFKTLGTYSRVYQKDGFTYVLLSLILQI